MNSTTAEETLAEVIDLAALSGPARRVVGFYDDFLAGRRHERSQLDLALHELDALTATPGRLGRDVRLLVNGGRGCDRQNVIDAIERLRKVTAIQAGSRRSTQRRRRRRLPTPGQLSLPGLDIPPATGALQ